MKPTITRGATNNVQSPENWDEGAFGKCNDLQVRMDVFEGNETKLIECFSTWEPSAEELAHLNRGGVIEVGLCVLNQPVMRLNVVAPVSIQSTDQVSLDKSEPPVTTINEEAHGNDHVPMGGFHGDEYNGV